ncbi:MAG: hypothetical protein Q9181_002953 [Wetmoreana brouardii]
MDITASTITIVTSTCSLVVHVKRLIQNVKQQDEKAKELEDKLDTLTTILRDAGKVYGPDETYLCSPSEQHIRQAVRKVVIRCNEDLERFKRKLKKLLSHGNCVSVALKQQLAAPALSTLEKSMSERQHHLSMLVNILQGLQLRQNSEVLREIHIMLQTLTNNSTAYTPSSTTSETQVADADSMISQVKEVAALIGEEQSEVQEPPESNAKGALLLQAIQAGDNDTFKSLLLDGDTSLKEKDDEDRNPLLLAAHLGRAGMVELLLPDDADVKNEVHTRICVVRDNSTDLASPSSPNHISYEKDTKTINHREIDLNSTDILGRTALHYCAEFDMCEEARFLLDHGVDVNARDKSDFPPAYFAAKNRKYFATELLLARGATTDFERPISTSFEIENLLEKYSQQ